MFGRILNKMRDKIREWKYVMRIHGEEEMNNDGLSIESNRQIDYNHGVCAMVYEMRKTYEM